MRTELKPGRSRPGGNVEIDRLHACTARDLGLADRLVVDRQRERRGFRHHRDGREIAEPELQPSPRLRFREIDRPFRGADFACEAIALDVVGQMPQHRAAPACAGRGRAQQARRRSAVALAASARRAGDGERRGRGLAPRKARRGWRIGDGAAGAMRPRRLAIGERFCGAVRKMRLGAGRRREQHAERARSRAAP